ncbi:glycosyltransferase family 4 protein [Dokdonia sp. Hel_I_53]|uniref:glycosyltransferase family 4 protein n=1 Tax=Dokdonia sp. Hel_I_53 TaxID=1566287 RepID=UPI00119970AF|nr:glycosyltransferase family 4 protein [Dokdonia sp. Hel_I_53]TVZ53399.1 glycosyltransferase involved in cell wall biosynthesis [Dokdonia sp. Hel_I_53]
MHIAFLTPEYPHPDLAKSGGLGTSIKNIATAMAARGLQVSVIVPYQSKDFTFKDDGISIYALGKKEYLFANWYFYKKYISKKIEELCTQHNINLIEGPDWTGIGTFIKFKVPYVVRLNGSDAYFCRMDRRVQKRKNFFLEKKNLQKANAILSASQYTADITAKIFKLKNKITTIHNAIDVEHFVPNHSKTKNQILYFGTVIRKKGVLDIAHAFNLVILQKPDTELLFLGKDVIDMLFCVSTISLIKDILSPQALEKTTFVNNVPYKEVQQYIAQAGVVCLPSYAEAFPMTWLEAMSMEKALVTSDIGWAQEMVIHGITGFMVNPSHHTEMSEYLLNFLRNPDLKKELGNGARERVKSHFSTQVIVEKNIAYYKKQIGV